ncbi:hypothetical protein [Bacteroides heparinolyticus]|uniref:hypothetical protein n=1 Tax=Prevotella heparinolytica TaxID=28113 RepID=UPI00359F37AD
MFLGRYFSSSGMPDIRASCLFTVVNPISSSPASPFRVETFGKMIDGKMGNNRFDAGIAVSIALEYRRFVFGAEAQVGLMTVNKQLARMSGMPDEEKYLPKNIASFFTLGYRFW